MNKENDKPTVLVVDDSRSIRSYVKTLLREAGCRVLEAADGATCLKMIESDNPDVVLLDMEMPGMSGLEVVKIAAASPHLFSIILFTTSTSQEEVAAGLNLGADDYIAKPITEVELLARVHAAVRNVQQKRALSQARHETEAALAELTSAQQKLVEQETVSAVARLAAGAAHHINNPLGFLMSNISALERYVGSLLKHADALSAELRQASRQGDAIIAELERVHRFQQIRDDLPSLLQETRGGGQRIALIIQQMAQLELGLAGHATTDLDLVRLLKPLVEMLTVLAPPGTKVQWRAPDEVVMVRGSQVQLNTALVALLKNACEALGTAPGTISVTVDSHPHSAEITIVNDGSGIPAEDLPSLFEPFFTTKTPESHVGLGLTIAQRFIAAHGGHLSLASGAGGTRVKVRLPREGAMVVQ
ncbi:hypothetical protein GMSM_37590 [Geomonas sp. Red276]